MKKILLIAFVLFFVILLFKLYFNVDYYSSGFYKDKKTNKFFYTGVVGSFNDALNNKEIISVPVLKQNGDTLESIDIRSFVRINNFYKDEFYVYRIKSQVEYLSIIAEPVSSIKMEKYFENSFYKVIGDTIFYESPAGGACNDLILTNKEKTFHVLDIDDVSHDCAITEKDLIFVNGCIINKSDLTKLDGNILDKINFSIENKIYKKVIEIGSNKNK